MQPLGVPLPGGTAYVQNPASIALPAQRTEQEQRAVDSQMIMQRHGPFRMYDEGTETFLRDYTDPENYSDKYNRLAERRERGHDRMVGLLNAGMITDTDLGWYDAKTQEKLANQYRADNVDPDWLARQQQAAKDTREANRYAMQQQRVQNREDIREARQETRDANRMARQHALGGTLLSDYNAGGWRFDGEGLTNRDYFIENYHKSDGSDFYNSLARFFGVDHSDAERVVSEIERYAKRNNKKAFDENGNFNLDLLREIYSAIQKNIEHNNSTLGPALNQKDYKSTRNFRDSYGLQFYLNAIGKILGLSSDYDVLVNSNNNGSGAGNAENEDDSGIKIVSEPLGEGEIIGPLPAEEKDHPNEVSETETGTAAAQTGASSFIPHDNTDVDFDALYDPEGEYMKALKWLESNPDSELARDLLADINAGKFGPLNGHTISMANFRQLATDSKRGPVHNAVMGLIGGDSPYWKNGKYNYDAAPWGNVTVETAPAEGAEGAVVKVEEAGVETPEEKAKREAEEKAAADAAEAERLKKEQEEKEKNKNGLPTWMRYAPIASSALGLLNPQLYRKDYTNANFLRSMANSLPDRKVRFRENLAKMRYTPVDRNMLTNTQNANMAAAMRGASGSNAGNAMAYSLALLRSGNEAIGSQYAQTATANNQMYNQAMQFNNAVNQVNAQGNFNAQTTNAQLGQQRDAMRNSLIGQYVQYREAADNGRNRALSTQLNSFSSNLGELGKEFYNRNTVSDLPLNYDERLNGSIFFKPDGNGGGGFVVPWIPWSQQKTQAAQTTQAAAPADGSVTLTKEQVDALTPEQKAQFNITSAYGSFLRPYYRRA